MTTLENYMSPALTRALGWTLLHSLWQGALVAAVLAGALLLLRRRRAEVRYAVSAAALGLVVALAGVTFGVYFRAGAPPTAPREADGPRPAEPRARGAAGALAAAAAPEARGWAARPVGGVQRLEMARAATPSAGPVGARPQWLASGLRYFDTHLPLLVVAWLLGLLAMSLRMVGGLLYVQRLRRYRVRPLGAVWQQRLAALAARSGLRRPVALLESALVQVPVVVGHARPVILLPLGAVAGLAPGCLEAILAHEMAHVLRRDYLVNLLQTVAEALFFYHPAVWFVANCVRTERENCCDDTATALIGGDALRLAHALTALAEWSHSAVVPAAPRLALAAMGRRGALLHRVRRLVQRRPAGPTLAEGLLAGALVLGGLGLLGGSVALAGPLAARLPFAPQGHQPAAEQDTTKGRNKTAAVPSDSAAAGVRLRSVARIDAVQNVVDDGMPANVAPPPGSAPATGPRQAPTGAVVITRDKKGRLTDLTVNGQRIEPAQLSRADRRAGRQVTVVPLPPTEQPAADDAVVRTGNGDDRNPELDQRMNRSMSKVARSLDKAGKELEKSGSKLNKAAGPIVYVSPGAADRHHPHGGSSVHIDIDDEALNQLASSAVALGNASLHIGLQAAALGIDEARRSLEAALRDPSLSAEGRRATQQALRELRRPNPRRATDKTDAENRAREAEDRKHEAEDRAGETRDRQRETQERRQELRERIRESEQELRDLEQAKMDRQQGVRDREQDARDRDRDRNDALTDALQRDGLIRDKDNYQLKLTARGLTVNGQEQPAKVQQKYLKLYESTGRKMSATGALVMNHSGSSTTSFSRSEPPRPPRPPRAPRAPGAPMLPPPPSGLPVAPRPPQMDTEALRNELRQDGVVGAGDKSFQLQLNGSGLTVNGKAQPAALAAKYRKLLGHDDGKNFNVMISSQE